MTDSHHPRNLDFKVNKAEEEVEESAQVEIEGEPMEVEQRGELVEEEEVLNETMANLSLTVKESPKEQMGMPKIDDLYVRHTEQGLVHLIPR